MPMLCKWLICKYIFSNFFLKINFNFQRILSTNQQNQLQQSPHSFYSSVPLNGCNNNTTTNTNSPSTADVQRMQQWFRHNDTSPYTSPLPSNVS